MLQLLAAALILLIAVVFISQFVIASRRTKGSPQDAAPAARNQRVLFCKYASCARNETLSQRSKTHRSRRAGSCR
jgi:hypothetical protein